MAPIDIIHLASAVISLILGPVIFLIAKGTRLHILLGRIYVVAMVILNATAMCIYRLFGGFGAFRSISVMEHD